MKRTAEQQNPGAASSSGTRYRLDKWLWAARFYKTRALSTEAIERGRVQVNGQPAKPSREVRCGDTIVLRAGFDDRTVEVLALSDVRGSATVAALLYRETPESVARRAAAAEQRRLAPAINTVQATAQRLNALSQRIERTSALLRTRVDIAAEAQNQQLLEKLTKGQELQLRLQSTVEGLSIAAISYYVISLILYAGKAAKAAGIGVHPEMLAGALTPVVVLTIWWATRQIRKRLHD